MAVGLVDAYVAFIAVRSLPKGDNNCTKCSIKVDSASV